MSVLLAVIRGESQFRLLSELSWDETYAGNVEFSIGGWQIVIFNDCDSLDYVDSAVAPDGRKGEYDDWHYYVGEECHYSEPIRRLNESDAASLEKLLKAAVHYPKVGVWSKTQ